MDLLEPGKISVNRVLFDCVLLITVLSSVSSVQVSGPPEINAVRGEDVTLPCSFTSSSGITSRMTVDWSFTPKVGGARQSFFHFSAVPFPPGQGPFVGRIKWLGRPSKGEATIQLLNATLSDNGTFTCSVRNPPDTHGAPAQIQLTVTPKKVTIRLSEVMVLVLFILVPSAVITLVLLCRMFCPCCPPRESEVAAKGQGYHSSIEVTERDMYDYKPPPPQKQRTVTCCEMCFMDSEDEDEYHIPQHVQRKGMEESQC